MWFTWSTGNRTGHENGVRSFVAYLDWLSAIHEFGHTASLEHRGHQDNPGDANEPTAIMHRLHGGGTEVNRTERDKLYDWARELARSPSAFWNDVLPPP